MITPTQYTPAIANEQRPENENMLKKLTKIDTRVHTCSEKEGGRET